VDNEVPATRVVFAEEADGGDRHMRDHRHGEGLEQQREAGAGSGLWNVDLPDAPMTVRTKGKVMVGPLG